MKNIILDNNYAQVSYDPSLKMGMVAWKQKASNTEYQHAFHVLLEHIKKNPMVNFLSDIRYQGVVSPENRKWFESVIIPQAIELGVKHGAVVFDGNVFKKHYLNMILLAVNKYGIPMKLFNTEEEAIKWFQSFNK